MSIQHSGSMGRGKPLHSTINCFETSDLRSDVLHITSAEYDDGTLQAVCGFFVGSAIKQSLYSSELASSGRLCAACLEILVAFFNGEFESAISEFYAESVK